MLSSLDEIFEDIKSFPESEIEFFLNALEKDSYSNEQVEQIYLSLKEGTDVTVIANPSLTVYEMEVARSLLSSGHSSECVRNLFTYDEDLVQRVISFYTMGHDIIDLIVVEHSNWFLEFLLYCVTNRVNLEILKNRDLDYNLIYYLANCIYLGYDVNLLLETYKGKLNELNRTKILDFYLDTSSPNKVYYVKRIMNLYEDDANDSCVVIAPSLKDSRLVACLLCYIDSFNSKSKEYDPSVCGYAVIDVKSLEDVEDTLKFN